MKNLFKSMMLVAAAAMGFTACSKDATEEFEPVAQATETITLSTDITRTTLNADRTQLTWVAGDQFAVYTDKGTKNTPVTYTEGATNFDIEVALGSQTVYAYYPYFDKQDISYDQTHVSMYVTSTQKQSKAGVFDGNVNDYAMVAKGEIDADRHVSLTFRPVACAMALNIYGGQAGETVQEVTFNPGVVCAGQHLMDITVDNPVYTAAEGKATSVTVTLTEPFEAVGEKPADPKTFANQVYAVVARKAYEGAAFTVKTSLNTYTFKTASTLDLSSTDFFTMNLNLAKGETPKRIPEGDYIIVATNAAGTSFDALTNQETNTSTKRLVSKSIKDVSSAETFDTNDETIIWHISQADASYVITDVNGKYISWTSGNSASLSSSAFNLDITPISGSKQYKITAAKDSARIFGKNTPANYFAFYTSEQSNKLYLIPAVSLPKCEINTFTATLNSEKTAITFEGTYTNTLGNEPDWSISVAKDGSEIGSIETIGVDGEITADNYSVTEEGTYTFTLTATINGEPVATETAEVVISGGGTSTYTVSITRPDFNGGNRWSSYMTQTAKVTGSDNIEYSVTAEGIAYQADYIQIRQSKNSAIYNTTSLGTIKSIVIEDTTKATYNVWVGTSQKPSTTKVSGDANSRTFDVTDAGNGYFKITNANTTISKITKITITYEK